MKDITSKQINKIKKEIELIKYVLELKTELKKLDDAYEVLTDDEIEDIGFWLDMRDDLHWDIVRISTDLPHNYRSNRPSTRPLNNFLQE